MESTPSGFFILSTENSSVIFPVPPHSPDTEVKAALTGYLDYVVEREK